MSNPDHIVECRDLTRTYVSRWRRTRINAVDGVSLDIPRGSAFALVGPNGAGKTTLMMMALGLIHPTKGTALINGHDARTTAARTEVGFVPEKFQLPAQLTGGEFLSLHADLARVEPSVRAKRIEAVVRHVDLADRINERMSTFSKGMQQRMAIAQALLGRPRLLVLDEPTSALDPIQRRRLREVLRAVHADGCTIVLNSHNLAEVEDICDHVAIIERGHIVATGAIADLTSKTRLVRTQIKGWTEDLATQLIARCPSAGELPIHSGGVVDVTLRIEGDDDVAWVARTVVESGAELLALTPDQEALEDIFLRTVRARPEVSE